MPAFPDGCLKGRPLCFWRPTTADIRVCRRSPLDGGAAPGLYT